MITVATTEDELDRVCDRLRQFDVRSIEVVAPSDTRRVVLAVLADEWISEQLAASFRAEGEMAVMRPEGGVRLQAWMRDTRPITFGGRLGVCRAWSEHERRGLPRLIELGPGGFGSGSHPTTHLLIEDLVERVRTGDRVLDVGCGSGVLGLCALELGARRAVGIDRQADAVDATRRNAVLNDVDDRMDASIAPLGEISGMFDVVVANIARAGVVELARALVERVAPNGWLAVSGISPSQCSQVAEFLHPLVEVERRTTGDWSSLVLAAVGG